MDIFRNQGLDALLVLIARSVSGDVPAAAAYARKRFGPASPAAKILEKAAVPGLEAEPLWISARSELEDRFAGQTVFDMLRLKRLVDPGVPMTRTAAASTAAFVGEGAAIPVASTAFAWTAMQGKKVASITVVSRESIEQGGARTLEVIARDAERAHRITADGALLSSAAAGAADAGLGFGVTPITASGAISDAVADAAARHSGDWASSVWIAEAWVAALLAAAGYEGVGLLGGELLGLPLLVPSVGTFRDSDGGKLMLIDSAQLLAVDLGIEVSIATSAMVEQDTGPTGNILAPTAATLNRTSLFAEDAIAIKTVRRLGWSAAGGSLVIVDGIG